MSARPQPCPLAGAGAPLLGVLGGMGPAATADFLKKLTLVTPAGADQEHVPVLACSIPQIPDRTAAILEDGPSPLPAMAAALDVLLRNGAAVIAMPCNTAHRWHAELQAGSDVPILHIADAVGDALAARGLTAMSVGLLATTATLQSRIYEARLAARTVALLTPAPPAQAEVMSAIRLTKAGRLVEAGRALRAGVEDLRRQGACAMILGCTELPLLELPDGPVYLDSTRELAAAAVAAVRHETLA